jgi:hypothetical protein
MNIAIVGNSINQLKNNDGGFIDYCDRVVRFNNYILEGKEYALGSKLDIHCIIGIPNGEGIVSSTVHLDKSFADITSKNLKASKEIWAVSQHNDQETRNMSLAHYEKFFGETKDIKFPFTNNDYLEAGEELAAIQRSLNFTQKIGCPSSGFMVVRKIVRDYADNACIYLFGFDPLCIYGVDHFSHASDLKRNDYHGHPYVSEGIYYQRLQAQQRIYLM